MATTKRPAPAKAVAATRVKAPAKTAAKPEPAAKKVAKTSAKAAPKTVSAKVARLDVKKAASVSAEQRRNYVEMAAYYIAERRGFAPGNPLEDWIQAEAEIDRLLAEGRVGG